MSAAPLVRAVLFDLDGTLLDSIPDLAEACRRMMLELGRPPHSTEVVRTFVGKGMLNLVARCLAGPHAHAVRCPPGGRGLPGDGPAEGLASPHADAAPCPPEELAAAVALFRRHYAEVNGHRTTLYEGVRPALEALAARGIPMACVTNKPAAFTLPLLERTGLAPFFGVTVSGDTLAEKKPHPAPLLHACAEMGVAAGEALMIGDSANDAEAARAAGMPVLLVTYGYSEGVAVDSIECDGLLSSLEDALPRLLGPQSPDQTSS